MARKKMGMRDDVISHRYPTRWKLCRHSQVERVGDRAKDQVLIPCKRRKEGTHILHLPTEIIFRILALLPANVLHEAVRCVCKHLCGVVSDPLFVGAYSQIMSYAGILIQWVGKMHQAAFIQEGNARFKVTKYQLPFPAKILGSSNGLLLLGDLRNEKTYHVINPVTKVIVNLSQSTGWKKNYTSTFSFGTNSHGDCVLVHVCGEKAAAQVEIRVFTLGIDKDWRYIDLQGITMSKEVAALLLYCPFIIAGVVYWCHREPWSSCFALDVDTEIIYQLPSPKAFINHFPMSVFWYIYLGTGIGIIKPEGLMCRLWKLDVRSGEWTELAGFNRGKLLERVNRKLHNRGPPPSPFIPLRLMDGAIWFYTALYSWDLVMVRYNLADDSFVFLQTKESVICQNNHTHVPTLRSPEKWLAAAPLQLE